MDTRAASATPAPDVTASGARTVALAAATLTCFAANSLLCRAALGAARADPGTFTAVRVLSGGLALAGLLAATRRARPAGGSWGSGVALVAYAAAFSLAYVRIVAGVGALVLFAFVQASMVGYGVATGARLGLRGWTGAALASGMGYAAWYAVLPALGAARGGTLQLAVPVLAALGAAAFLGERLTGRLVGAGLAILVGVALSVAPPRRPAPPHSPR